MSKDLAAYIETAVKEKVVPVLASNNVRTDTFMTALQIAVVTHKDAAKFSNNKASLYTAIVRCANDGLLPDGKEAALIIYNEKQPDGFASACFIDNNWKPSGGVIVLAFALSAKMGTPPDISTRSGSADD